MYILFVLYALFLICKICCTRRTIESVIISNVARGNDCTGETRNIHVHVIATVIATYSCTILVARRSLSLKMSLSLVDNRNTTLAISIRFRVCVRNRIRSVEIQLTTQEIWRAINIIRICDRRAIVTPTKSIAKMA